jgi:hypothetical protein
MWGLTSVAVALLAAGCFRPHPATGSPCTTDSDCPSELVCSHGSCETTVAPDDAAPGDDAPLADTPVDMPAAAGPMLVQQTTASQDRAATLSATLLAAPAAGNVLVMIGANQHTTDATSVTGGGANWTKIVSSPENANIEVWYGITDGSHTPVTLDCGLSGCETQPIWMHLSEWSGLATTGLVEPPIASNGLASPARAGSITTHGAQDVIIFAVADAAPNTVGTPTPGTWTALTEVAPVAVTQFAWYQIGPPGTYTPSVTETGHSWDAALVALRAR